MMKIVGSKSFLLNLKKEFNLVKEKEVKQKIDNIISSLKDATPVDTGNAKDSWKNEKSTIINDADYIKYLNEGSSVQAPKHFIEQTVLSQKGVRPSGTIVVDK